MNEQFRNIPIEVAGSSDHTVTIDKVINVAVDFPLESTFGDDFLDNFDLRQFPSRDEFDDWLKTFAHGKYNYMSEGDRIALLRGNERIIHILIEAALKKCIKDLGLERMTIDIDMPTGIDMGVSAN